ncbi:hypothetical protein M0813_00406 [Anaeramoeba flamelloides]|uniref:PH domain-containing protein n=1 Tax=Anaeramoeba flamelloides TaxID=1746091 RepID=A0AAV7YXJ4_9EUKA|nr:hypothetical protein M0812_01725 [Anaeramoeba flamelloides]KAJ6241702.1 hypothetical protein M0813_00406 [Anaeramoeba flamelloides]
MLEVEENDGDVYFSSYLYLQSGWPKSFNRKWVEIFENGKLKIRKELDTKVKITKNVKDALSIEPIDTKIKGIKDRHVGKSFQIQFEKKTFIFLSESRSERDEWVTQCNNVIEGKKPQKEQIN